MQASKWKVDQMVLDFLNPDPCRRLIHWYRRQCDRFRLVYQEKRGFWQQTFAGF